MRPDYLTIHKQLQDVCSLIYQKALLLNVYLIKGLHGSPALETLFDISSHLGLRPAQV